MNELQSAILKQLKWGHANATTGEILAKRLGFKDDRAIRSTIEKLIEAKHPILSAVKPPYGYFFAENRDEALQCRRTLQNRIINNCRRLKYVKLATQNITQPGQLKLALGA